MLPTLRLALLLGCCAVPAGHTGEPGSFKRDVVPLFKSRCVMCHLPDSGQAGLTLHPNGGYAKVVGVKSTQSPLLLVEPGSPEKSYLYRKLIGDHTDVGGAGERMPFGDTLSAEQIETVRRWIEDGAQNN